MTRHQRDDHEALNRCRTLIREAVARFRREEREGLWTVVKMGRGKGGVGCVQIHKHK